MSDSILTTSIAPSELIINSDGSVFHLHLRPEQLATKVIMMGDPERVTKVAAHFDSIECEVRSREFHTITGVYHGKRITALSHGIGGDNIDIVMTELDALANIDFETRLPRAERRTLNIVRLGTSGGMQPYAELGSHLLSIYSIGYEGAIYFYKGNERVRELGLEEAFHKILGSVGERLHPYAVAADELLTAQIGVDDMFRGITISANGFYGAQGRRLRLALEEPELNERIEAFRYMGQSITNYEMEGAALAAMARLLGHRAVTVCAIIANRHSCLVNVNYQKSIDELVVKVLERI